MDIIQGNARIPPQNIEAEQAVLGAILVNNRALEKVSEFLQPIHFVHPVHGKIYEQAWPGDYRRRQTEHGRVGEGRAEAEQDRADRQQCPLLRQ